MKFHREIYRAWRFSRLHTNVERSTDGFSHFSWGNTLIYSHLVSITEVWQQDVTWHPFWFISLPFSALYYWFVKMTKAVLYLENQAVICQTCSWYQLQSVGGKNSFQFAACLFSVLYFYFSTTHSNLIKMQICQNQGLSQIKPSIA